MSSMALQIESWADRMTFSNLPLILCADRVRGNTIRCNHPTGTLEIFLTRYPPQGEEEILGRLVCISRRQLPVPADKVVEVNGHRIDMSMYRDEKK